jgi:hypothetical protein
MKNSVPLIVWYKLFIKLKSHWNIWLLVLWTAAGLERYVDSLMKRTDIEFNVWLALAYETCFHWCVGKPAPISLHEPMVIISYPFSAGSITFPHMWTNTLSFPFNWSDIETEFGSILAFVVEKCHDGALNYYYMYCFVGCSHPDEREGLLIELFHVFHIGKLRVKLRKGWSTKAREAYSAMMKVKSDDNVCVLEMLSTRLNLTYGLCCILITVSLICKNVVRFCIELLIIF